MQIRHPLATLAPPEGGTAPADADATAAKAGSPETATNSTAIGSVKLVFGGVKAALPAVPTERVGTRRSARAAVHFCWRILMVVLTGT